MQTIEMTVSAQTQRRRRKRRSKFPRLFLTALAAFAAARLVLWAIDISAARAGASRRRNYRPHLGRHSGLLRVPSPGLGGGSGTRRRRKEKDNVEL